MTAFHLPLAPMVFSASRIESFIACQRKWAAHYLLDFQEQKSEALNIGTETHAQMEKLVRFGTPIDMTVRSGPLANALEPHIRQYIQKPGVWAEGEFTYQGRHLWRGYKDLEEPGLVLDYKTSSDPVKWAPTAQTLLFDPQAILYAAHHFSKYPNLADTELRWLYVGKRTPHRVYTVSVRMTVGHARRGFDVLETLADQALLLRAKDMNDVLLLPMNRHHCKAYGGCPHQIACGTLDFTLGQ